MGQLFVFSAPSGAGKTTIITRIQETLLHIGYSVSHTSRSPRKNETHGVHYYFVDKERFRNQIDAHAFVEWAEVYGNYYGTSFKSLDEQLDQGRDVLLDLDPQGAKNIKAHYKNSVLIFVVPPTLETLKKRLTARGTDDETTLNHRFQKALADIGKAVYYDFVVINDDLETAVTDALSIILSQRCRRSFQLQKLKDLFGAHIFDPR